MCHKLKKTGFMTAARLILYILWESVSKHEKVWKHMRKCGNTWESVETHEKVWKHMRKCGNTWIKGSKPYKVCQIMRKCVKPVKVILSEQKHTFCSTMHAFMLSIFLNAVQKSAARFQRRLGGKGCRSLSYDSLLLSKSITNCAKIYECVQSWEILLKAEKVC